MAECIEKAAILSKCEEMWNNADETTQSGVDTINTIDRITDLIEAMPVADVQPVKRGRWVEKPPYKDEIVKGLEFQIVCSECDEQNCSIEFDECHNPIGKTFYKTSFCPNCGADMRDDVLTTICKMRNLTDEEGEIYDSWLDKEAIDVQFICKHCGRRIENFDKVVLEEDNDGYIDELFYESRFKFCPECETKVKDSIKAIKRNEPLYTMDEICEMNGVEFNLRDVIDGERVADVQPVDKWINAQTNPPIATDGEISDYVLVYRASGRQCVCYYVYDDGGNYWCSEDEKSMYDIDEVTHWQPLPESPSKQIG